MGIKATLKKSRLTYSAAKFVRKIPFPVYRGWMILCHKLFGTDGRKVYFSSFSGASYNDNPRYISEALHRMDPSLKLVWRLPEKTIREGKLPSYITPAARFSPKALYHMATARVIVKNANMKPYMLKFPDQYYVQPWHGDRGFKLLRPEMNGLESKYMDLFLTGSRFASEYMPRMFSYTGEVLERGCPRNDILLSRPADVTRRVREELGLPDGTRALLYAPTFRDRNTGSKAGAGFSLKRLRETLEETTGAKWEILLRGHTLNGGVDADEGLDVSDYPDASELMLACDALITDYSSIACDFILLDRPALLYHADRDSYTDRDRTFAVDPEKTPFRVAHSEEELFALIRVPFDAAENCRAIRAYFGTAESGHASEAAAERILEKISAR